MDGVSKEQRKRSTIHDARITILGCGPSGGVPLIGCECAVCRSSDPKNKRSRASIYVTDGTTRILVDTSPDLHSQALRHNISMVDAILYTHAHADHCHGIDDVRAFNYHSGKAVDVYADPETLCELTERFAYAFGAADEKVSAYKPLLRPIAIDPEKEFMIGTIPIRPIPQFHGKGKSLGYRIGNFAYSPDVDKFEEKSLQLLESLDVWVVDCLRVEPAPTHAHLALTLEWIDKLKPKRAILTHMTHVFEYHAFKASLPPNVEPAYDGMAIDL